MDFKKIDINNISFNPFSKIGNEWMLITAGNEEKVNTMTASWGGLGVLWGKNVAFTFIRPQRYTKKFIDSNEFFSLCFFEEEYKKTLGYLGSVSGRDEDKISKSGLKLCFLDNVPCFEDAKIVVTCRKIYRQELDCGCFLDEDLDEKWYGNKDYHFMYVGEIWGVYGK